MSWVFGDCPDQYGLCIRQYINLVLSIFLLFFALISTYKTYKMYGRTSFEFLPLAINTVTLVIMTCFSTQMEVYNTRIITLIIQFYTFFIITYGFLYMNMQQQENPPLSLKILQKIFIGLSALCFIAICLFFILQTTSVITCNEDQGIGSVVLTALEIPLFIVAYYYGTKSGQIIKGSQIKTPIQLTAHVMEEEDSYVNLKMSQLKLVKSTFGITIAFHVAEICLYFIGNLQILCVQGKNEIKVTNGLQLLILCLQNISELLPHFMIPLIFWYIPGQFGLAKALFMTQTAQISLKTEKGQKNPTGLIFRQASQLVEDINEQQSIRKRLIPRIPLRTNSQIP